MASTQKQKTAFGGSVAGLLGCVRTKTTGTIQSVLGYLHHGLQSVKPLTEHLTLLGKGNLLLHGGPDAEELAYFIEGTAEA